MLSPTKGKTILPSESEREREERERETRVKSGAPYLEGEGRREMSEEEDVLMRWLMLS